jgi:hexosaminidase
VWQARQWLETWRDNDVKLRPTLGKSELTEELVPVSEKLARVAAIGLRALDDIEKHHAADRASTDKDLAVLKAAEKPVAVLRDMIVPSVEILVSAAGGK